MKRLAMVLLALVCAAGPAWGTKPDQADAQGGEAAVVKGSNGFALELYKHIAGKEGNLFFCPASAHAALAMTYAGARGNTAAEMAKTLHYGQGEKFFAAYGRVIQQMQASKDAKYKLAIANALWLQEDKPFLEEFLGLNTKYFHAGLFAVNFKTASGPARKRINKWVEDKTQEKIENLLPAGSLDARTRMVLTNAIYFKGDWASQFKKDRTQDMDFQVSAERKVKVPMMRQTSEFGYAETTELQVLKMPYAGDDLSMVVLLPRQSVGIRKLESSLTDAKVAGWLKSLGRSQKVRVYLPRFKMTHAIRMNDVLTKMGMPEAFSTKADFSGMTGSQDLFISGVYHKAFVQVNEEGTEAAGATGVVMKPTAVPAPPPVFKADRPFLFLIRHEKAGVILFLGRVREPKD